MAITANPRGPWSERNIADIAECMDIAFAKVLADEFGRLTAGMTSSQIDNWLWQSEQSILRLRNGSDMPDYSDPMVVLWYAIQYQMGHINLAYTLIKDTTGNSGLTDAGRLQVADFGAGCLAMQFGLALAVADNEFGLWQTTLCLCCQDTRTRRSRCRLRSAGRAGLGKRRLIMLPPPKSSLSPLALWTPTISP